MRLIKFTQVATAMCVILVMLIMFQGSLFIPLAIGPGTLAAGGRERSMAPNEQVAFTTIFTVALIFGGEVARNWVSQAFKMDAGKLPSSPNTGMRGLGRVWLVRQLIGLPLLFLLTLGANAFLCYGLVRNISGREGRLPWPFWMVVGIYVVYFLIRRPLARALKGATKPGTRGGKLVASVTPTFTLEGNVIVLDLKRKRARPGEQRGFISVGSEPCIVRIAFDELDEVRAMSYVEAQSYVQYEIGPDVQLALKNTTELYRYIAGQVERPTYYGHWGAVGTTLALRGPALFYLVSVANENVDELLAAFSTYKQSAGPALPAGS